MWDVRDAMPSIVEAADVIEASSRLLRASAADRIERSWTRLEKDMILVGVDVRRQDRLDSQLQRVGEGVSRDELAQIERMYEKPTVAETQQGIYVRSGNVEGRRLEVAKEELMGMFGSRRTKIGVSKRRRGCSNRKSFAHASDAG